MVCFDRLASKASKNPETVRSNSPTRKSGKETPMSVTFGGFVGATSIGNARQWFARQSPVGVAHRPYAAQRHRRQSATPKRNANRETKPCCVCGCGRFITCRGHAEQHRGEEGELHADFGLDEAVMTTMEAKVQLVAFSMRQCQVRRVRDGKIFGGVAAP